MPEAVIVSVARSPIGRAIGGSLKCLRADELAAQMVRAALGKVPALAPEDVDDLILGCALPGGEQGFNVARNVAVLAAHDDLPGTTVTRYCASGLQAIRMAFHAIRAGEGEAYVSAGVETVSRFAKGTSDSLPDTTNPLFVVARVRTEQRSAGGAPSWTDPRDEGALPDAYIDMGQAAENVQQLLGIGREAQDCFAVRSQNLVERRIAEGFWGREITPVTLPDGGRVTADDSPRPGVTYAAVSQLHPIFRPDGSVTAGNASPLNDGAAALVIMSDRRAAELDLVPLARIVSTAVTGLSPEIDGLGPVEAVPAALRQASMSLADVDLFEIDEVFAVQVLGFVQQIGVDMDRVNVNGGGIALGHPFGMAGVRIAATLMNSLQWHDRQIGVASMGARGGMGMAVVLERLN